MRRRTGLSDPECAIAHACEAIGDWWSLLLLRDVARGRHRFEELRAGLGVSRKVLSERLQRLVEDGVLDRRQYSDRPPRHEYRLTERGRGALPILVALQDWGDRWLLGEGESTATAGADTAEARRVHALVGTRIPELAGLDPVAPTPFTVLYCYPGTSMPGSAEIPGAAGCTLESCTYRDRLDEFARSGAAVRGVSTQRPADQAAFAAAERIQFPLLSDAELELASALRLPTFRAGGTVRLKRLTLVVDAGRTVRAVRYPVPDVTGGVEETLRLVRGLAGPGAGGAGGSCRRTVPKPAA